MLKFTSSFLPQCGQGVSKLVFTITVGALVGDLMIGAGLVDRFILLVELVLLVAGALLNVCTGFCGDGLATGTGLGVGAGLGTGVCLAGGAALVCGAGFGVDALFFLAGSSSESLDDEEEEDEDSLATGAGFGLLVAEVTAGVTTFFVSSSDDESEELDELSFFLFFEGMLALAMMRFLFSNGKIRWLIE